MTPRKWVSIRIDYDDGSGECFSRAAIERIKAVEDVLEALAEARGLVHTLTRVLREEGQA